MKKINEDVKITRESDLTDFEFLSGANYTVKFLTDDELRQIADILDELNPDGMTETEVNDFFWFEDDTIAEWLGYSSFDELVEDREEGLNEDTSGETVASYQGEGKDTVDVIKGSDGKFIHSYKKDGKEIIKSDSFSTQDEAEKELIKNNPKAKKLTEAVSSEDRMKALADFLKVDPTAIKSTGDNTFEVSTDDEDAEYLVLDDDESYRWIFNDIENLVDDVGLTAFTPRFQEMILEDAVDSSVLDDAVDELIELDIKDMESEEDDVFGNRLIAEMYESGILKDEDFEYGYDDNPNYSKLDLSPNNWDSKLLEFKVSLKDDKGDPKEYLERMGMDLKELIKDHLNMEKVVDMAIDLDGYGHFISMYDGHQLELSNGLFAYRVN